MAGRSRGAWAGGSAALLLALAGVGYAVLLRAELPADPGGSRAGTVQAGDVSRTFRFYVPERLASPPALVLAFHGSRGSGAAMRAHTGYVLERLADAHGFVVAYPDGYQGHWNDCRARGPYAANRENVDDPGFVRALIEHFRAAYGVRDVLALGLSNGGHMVYRLALETPGLVTAFVAFAASLPAPGNSDCTDSAAAVPVLIVNGTDDPISPYDGGVVTIFGFGDRGRVLSTLATARHFAERAGATGEPVVTRVPEGDGDPRTRTERARWRGVDADVELITVRGGGHTIPQPGVRLPRLLGRASGDVNGPEEAWRFFEQARARASAAAAHAVP